MDKASNGSLPRLTPQRVLANFLLATLSDILEQRSVVQGQAFQSFLRELYESQLAQAMVRAK